MGGKGLKTHRPPGVQLLGGNADFRPQAKFAPVRKAGGGVYIYGSAVRLLEEALGIGIALGDNALAVPAGILRLYPFE